MQPLDIFNSSSPWYYTYGVSVCSTITGKYSLNTHTHPSLFCWCPQFVVSITNRAYVYHWEIDLLYNYFPRAYVLQLFDGAHHYLLRNLWRSPAEWLQQNKKRLPNQICLSTLIWGYCRFYSAFYICKQVVYTVWCSRIALSLFFVCASFYMKTFSWIFVFITIISLFFLQPFPEFFGTES